MHEAKFLQPKHQVCVVSELVCCRLFRVASCMACGVCSVLSVAGGVLLIVCVAWCLLCAFLPPPPPLCVVT